MYICNSTKTRFFPLRKNLFTKKEFSVVEAIKTPFLFSLSISILLIVFTLSGKAQMPAHQNILMRNGGELAHELVGHIICEAIAWPVYKWTKLSVGKGLSVGILTAVAAGAFKEWIYDKQWGLGVFSIMDFLNTVWGALVGAVCIIPAMVIHMDKVYALEEEFGNIGDRIFVHPSDSLSVTGDTVFIKIVKPIKLD